MKNAEINTKSPRCQYISKIGSRCHADVQTGKPYCFFHDSGQKNKQAQVHKEARKEDGESLSHETDKIATPPDLPVIPLLTAFDVAKLLAETINRFRRREIDLLAAKAISNMANLLLRSLKEAALEEQLASAGTMSYYSQSCEPDESEDEREVQQDQSTVSSEPVASAQDLERHSQQSWSQDLRG
jgi:hypothetical protein